MLDTKRFAKIVTEVEEGLIPAIVKLYDACYEARLGVYGQEQRCYTTETLVSALRDEEYVKFVLFEDGEGSPVIGFGLFTNNLEKARITYVSPEALTRFSPISVRDRKLYYFTFIGIHPSFQKLGHFFDLLAPVAIYAEKNNIEPAFDFSHNGNGSLPQMLQGITVKLKEIGLVERIVRYKKMDAQEYGKLEWVYGL